MVNINGKHLQIYDLDTIDTIVKRVANNLKTIPKYLYFTHGFPTIEQFYTDNNIQVEDLLEYIKQSNSAEFTPIFSIINDKLSQTRINLYEDIFKPFVSYNKTFSQINPSFLGAILLSLQEDLKDNSYFPNIKVDVRKIWDERNQVIGHIDSLIKSNENDDRVTIRQNTILDEKTPIPYTNFELERVKFKIFLNIKKMYIIEIFNLIHLTPRTPFATVNGFYKILKDNVPSKDWGISLENDIVIKVCQLAKLPTTPDYDSYTDVILSINNNVVSLEIELDTGKQNISRELFIQECLSIFPTIEDINVDKIEEKAIKGSFYFPKSTINNYILSDLIMNDKLFLSMMSIDEHDKASKRKNSIYVHFNNNKIGSISANITEKLSEKGDPLLRGKDINDLFKYNSYYIRVKISNAKNLRSVHMFQDILGKFLSIYYDKYDSIYTIYHKFIPTFGQKPNVKTKDIPKLKLGDIAPEVFLPNYTKKCNDKPTIISDEEVEAEEAKGKQVMRYPLTENEGFKPRNYICNHTHSPYPGLRENPLENNELVPYIPCCFKRDHSQIEGNIYAHYYKGEELKNPDKKQQQDFISTTKFTPFNWHGLLPENIISMFSLFDRRDDYSFVRKGMSTSKSSFLECVMEALEESNILSVTEKNRAALLEKHRLELSTKPVLCKQEMYDYTSEEISDLIKNPNVYLDPQYFINLLETVYNCNIYVFNRKNMKNNAQLMLPRFLEGYYKTKKHGNCIFIYQHMGSSSDHATEPRCELILRWKETNADSIEYSFNQVSGISKGVNDIFLKMILSYSLNTEVKETIFPIINSQIKILEQGMDSYGKTRMIRIKFQGSIVTLLTSPIQPINYPEVSDWVITNVSEAIALKLCNVLDIKITGQDVTEDFAKTFNGILGNVTISIPLENSIPTSDFQNYKFGINYPESALSDMNNYNKYKKLARYMTSYVFWLYSKYLKEENKSISLDTMYSFRKEYIMIDKNFEYNGNISKKFSMKNSLMKNGKLVVKSEETLKRLMYSLRLFSRQRITLLNYHTMETMENYYIDLTDFDQFQFQVIIQGENALENWVNDNNTNYKLHDTIQTGINETYFFKNKLVSDYILLAQNTDSIQKALKIAKVWKKSGYNIGGDHGVEEHDKLGRFLLFSYENSKNITLHEIGGKHVEGDPMIIGYKIDNVAFYTTLLNL